MSVFARSHRFVGDARKASLTAARIIDAKGLVGGPVSSIPHTHTLGDLSDQNHKSNEAYLMQGVTTVVTGNDGGSVLNVGEILKRWDEQGIALTRFARRNTARFAVTCWARPTRSRLRRSSRNESFVARAMDEGAFGLSTGLYYAPGSYAKTEEVIELSKVAAAKGGIYDTHMRDESSYSIGLLVRSRKRYVSAAKRRSRAHLAHQSARPGVWGQSKQAIELIRKARAEGVEASACQYPYDASGTTWRLPWFPAGGGRRPRGID